MDFLHLVAVKSPFNQSLLTYKATRDTAYGVGAIVEVPLGSRIILGVVIKTDLPLSSLNGFDETKLKYIKHLYDDNFVISENELNFFTWVAKYYHYQLGPLLFESIPPKVKRLNKLKVIEGSGLDDHFKLNEIQQKYATLIKNAGFEQFNKWLVHGVTGSGKTALYISVIQAALKEKKSALFLLPEINLSPQFVEKFSQRLTGKILTYNSSMTNSQKYNLWNHLINSDEPVVIIGVRSAIFLPVQNLGLIIVDEEHDQSFKQSERCAYNARDLAFIKANMHQAQVILGSATPSVETFYKFKGSGNYLPMQKRIGISALPDVTLVDLKEKKINDKTYTHNMWPLNEEALVKIQAKLDKKEQVLVFVNRLGYANYLQCRSCARPFDCPNCSISLKFYKLRNELSCNICNYKIPKPEVCPDCGNLKIIPKGFGTEKVKDVLCAHFQSARIERFDRDEVKNAKELEAKLKSFHAGEIDIFVGTQMLSKGHNFKNVNLVVVLGLDSQLNFPDFRASERVYQLLEQVSGRSGRFEAKSEVIVLSLCPENKVFQFVKNHSFNGAFEYELPIREMCSYPPFSFLAAIYITSNKFNLCSSESFALVQFAQEVSRQHFKQCSILGPRPALIEKRANKFTWTIVIKSKDRSQLHNLLNTIKSNYKFKSGVIIKIDIDPYFIA